MKLHLPPLEGVVKGIKIGFRIENGLMAFWSLLSKLQAFLWLERGIFELFYYLSLIYTSSKIKFKINFIWRWRSGRGMFLEVSKVKAFLQPC
ncbi:MAG: hypothetical protein K6E97_07120 [Treponema sp.]|nr:hypothetical protein [Treponema sp.]